MGSKIYIYIYICSENVLWTQNKRFQNILWIKNKAFPECSGEQETIAPHLLSTKCKGFQNIPEKINYNKRSRKQKTMETKKNIACIVWILTYCNTFVCVCVCCMAPVAVIRLKFVPARFPSLRQLGFTQCLKQGRISINTRGVVTHFEVSVSHLHLWLNSKTLECGVRLFSWCSLFNNFNLRYSTSRTALSAARRFIHKSCSR